MGTEGFHKVSHQPSLLVMRFATKEVVRHHTSINQSVGSLTRETDMKG